MGTQIRTTMDMEEPMEDSTLQVLVSGRILITGILNEILLVSNALKRNKMI